MAVPDPIILYSTNTWLAYRIAEVYYLGQHYVWCNRYFDSRAIPNRLGIIPPTSNPSEIYHSLHAEVTAGDLHSAKIQANRVGILKGATHKKDAGVISEAQEREIIDIVSVAQVRDFKPLLYLIPFAGVKDLLSPVPIMERAHPLWEGYILDALPSDLFDVIELARS